MADLLASSGTCHQTTNGTVESEQSVHLNEFVSMDQLKELGLDASSVEVLTEQALGWASAHGVTTRFATSLYNPIPFSLLPIKFPRSEFEKGVALSPVFCRLVNKLSLDLEWLHKSLQSVSQTDMFTSKLLELSMDVHKEGLVQTAQMGIFRSDYMLHDANDGTEQRIQQVELNTISASFGSFSTLICKLHKFLLGRYCSPKILSTYGLASTETLDQHLLTNPVKNELILALAEAFKYYGAPKAVILFVIQPNERNSVDQRMLEYTLWDTFQIPVVRRTLEQIAQTGRLDGPSRKLILEGDIEVAVTYFRAGYTPNDYPEEIMWDGRRLIERSYSIKCPSIAYHLSGAKKVQQMLANPLALSKFVSSDEMTQLLACFTGLYGLEKNLETTKGIIERALANPDAFVMKPQREGGGNNLYGEDIVKALKSMTVEELESYILMNRITSPKQTAILVRNGEINVGKSISEIGYYGVCLFDNEKEIFNRHAGHLLRTKLESVNEGGVATGYAVLSSPFLV